MMYRKAPPRPTRFLLKIATAGAGAMIGIACSSSDHVVSGTVVMPPDDAGDASHPCDPNPCGVVANPEAGDDSMAMGIVWKPEAGDEQQLMGLVDAGIIANPEAGDEQPVGVVANPEAGDENQPMGAIDAAVGVVANPEAGHD